MTTSALRTVQRSGWIVFHLLVSLSLLVACGRGQPTLTAGPAPTLEPGGSGGGGGADDTPIAHPTAAPLATPTAPVPAFGLLVIIPDETRSTSDAGALQAAADSGARYLRAALEWAIAEPAPGQLSFDTRNDRRIASVEAAGLRLFPTLYVGRGWMNGNPPDADHGGSRSFPPDDLSATWDDASGYSPSYYNFVYQFVSHYRGHFDYIAIENEANSKLFWGGTEDEYVRLLKTAYLAIKAADPHVRVTDSGMVSSAWGLCMVADYLASGRMSREAALALAIEYYAAESATQGRIQTAVDVERELNRDRTQEQCRRIGYILDHSGGAVDAFNFHFYEDYNAMRLVAEWVRARLKAAGYSAGMLTHELGQRGLDTAFAESEAQAQSVFKKLVTGASLGLEVMVWFSADTINTDAPSPDKVGLFNPDGSPRLAAQTFQRVAETLSAGYRFDHAPMTGPSWYHYVFADATGGLTLEALWAEGASRTVTLAAPTGYTTAVVTDYLGQTQTLAVRQGAVTFTLTAAPVFVRWQ
jgi:hypothetical protein